MLDRAFMGRFFNQLEALTDEELQEKESAIETHMRTFSKGSEAHADARFMLKHIRRARLERLFTQPKNS